MGGEDFFFVPEIWKIACILRTKCRMSMIFYSTQSPTHLDHFQYLYHGDTTSRKFFRATWISKTPPKTASCSYFWLRNRSQNLPSERVWNQKYGHQLTLFALESDWDVVWPPRLLFWISMILNNIPNILVVMQKALKNLFESSRSQTSDLQTLYFWLKFEI